MRMLALAYACLVCKVHARHITAEAGSRDHRRGGRAVHSHHSRASPLELQSIRRGADANSLSAVAGILLSSMPACGWQGMGTKHSNGFARNHPIVSHARSQLNNCGERAAGLTKTRLSSKLGVNKNMWTDYRHKVPSRAGGIQMQGYYGGFPGGYPGGGLPGGGLPGGGFPGGGGLSPRDLVIAVVIAAGLAYTGVLGAIFNTILFLSLIPLLWNLVGGPLLNWYVESNRLTGTCPECGAPAEILKGGTGNCQYCGAQFTSELSDSGVFLRAGVGQSQGTRSKTVRTRTDDGVVEVEVLTDDD